MNKIQKTRLYYLIFFLIGLGISASLILYALKQNINVFFTPTQLSQTKINSNYQIRLGGMVKNNSVTRDQLQVRFIVTDFKHDIVVQYHGILPDLFREGKGVIAEGKLNANGILIANQVLAKHDENYMPKNVYQSLRKSAAS